MFDVNKLIDEQSFQDFIEVFKNAKPVATITATDLEQYGVKQVLQWGPNFVELPPTYKINPNDIPWPEAWEGFWTEMHQVKLLATIWEVTSKELAARFGMTDSGVKSALNATGHMKPSLQDRPLKWARGVTAIAKIKYGSEVPELVKKPEPQPIPIDTMDIPVSQLIEWLNTPMGKLDPENVKLASKILKQIEAAIGE